MKKGIDISYHQGAIDFAKVKASGIEFAILRSGYGEVEDKKVREYYQQCKTVGIVVPAVYHFSYATSVAMAVREADKAINICETLGMAPRDTRIFYDFEYDTVDRAKKNGYTLTKANCIAFTRAFCDRVISRGWLTGIYANEDYKRNWYDEATIKDYAFWYARLNGQTYESICLYQQYSHTGRVDGINTNVDMNYYFGGSFTLIPDQTTPKTNEQIAQECIDGKWGNGDDRKQRLEYAGYNYYGVQKEVNRILEADSKKSIGVVASECIDGQWGNGAERKQKLEAAGYNYDEVQKEVNRQLKM